MTRVAFDDQIVCRQPIGGINRYLVGLITALEQNPELAIDARIAWSWSRCDLAVGAGMGRRWPRLTERIPAPFSRRPVLRLANRRVATRALLHADLVHHTYYDARYLSAPHGLRRAVTVHDMIPELRPELFPHGNPHLAKERFVRNADLVCCVSEATKLEMLQVYGSIDAAIIVTPLGVDGRYRPDPSKPSWLPERFVLHVGRRDEYKDFATLLVAFAALGARQQELVLIAVGGGPFDDDTQALIHKLGVDGRVQQRSVPEAEMPGVYTAAACLAFPSRHEGFGLPTVEAMACGCPVILAGGPALHEVGAEAALYYQAGDSAALAAAMARVLDDPKLAADLSAKGLGRAREFSWDRCAAATAAGYQAVLAG